MKRTRSVASGSFAPLFPSSTSQSEAASPASPLDRLALKVVARQFHGARLHVRLWDGTTIGPAGPSRVGALTIKDRPTLWRLLLQPNLAGGEAYMSGRLEVDGDLTEIFEAVNMAFASRGRPRGSRLMNRVRTPASFSAARANVHHHYDLGNAFYRLWLDDAMVYTCAYFDRPDIDLEAAQQAKLEYICRKLALRPGDRVIEAGCGWGALAIYMAKHYGVRVAAYNISREQLAYAREEAARQRVADRVTFIDGDVRSITGHCDAFVSIGMLEHVGPSNFRAMGALINRVIDKVHGRGLLHFIARDYPKPFEPWIRRYIFPGAYAPALSEVTAEILEIGNISVTDVENLRPHYAATLRLWRERFERHVTEVSQMFDQRFIRMWRLYLASAEASFRTGNCQLFQVAFGRPADPAHRWTRADLYTPMRPRAERHAELM